MIDFPSSPTVGQIFTASGVNWTWDGFKWTAGGLNVGYLPMTGGTLTGPLTLAADPVVPLQAATMQYVDGRFSYPSGNRIINGDMRIDQRNNGASGTTSGYTVDRWIAHLSVLGKGTWGRNSSGPPWGFGYALLFSSSSAYAAAAADIFCFQQTMEADAITDFAWGTAGAQPVTLSFWAYSSLTGTFSGSLCNYAYTRAYPFSYSIPTANTWTKIVVTIPGDTGGTWVLSGNGGALTVNFDLGTGTTNRGPAGAWTSTGYCGATGSVSVVATNGATFQFTGVKLEIGSVATPFNRQSLAKSLADCQRYYQTFAGRWDGYASAGNLIGATIALPVIMRAAPTTVPSFTGSANNTGSTVNPLNSGNIQVYTSAVASGAVVNNVSMTLSAEL